MKLTNAEIIKNQGGETDTRSLLENARMMVSSEQMEAHEAEEDARSLELELIEAQAAHERKEEAERQGRETNEKIAELTG